MSEKMPAVTQRLLSIITTNNRILTMIKIILKHSDAERITTEFAPIKRRLISLHKGKLRIRELPKCFHDLINEIVMDIKKAIAAKADCETT